jgi:hypothetical protein
MDHNTQTDLLAHIGVPLLAVIAIILFRMPARSALTFRETCNELALEFAILGIGATGGVFLNPKINNSGVYGILTVLLGLVFAAFIVVRTPSATQQNVTLTIGPLTIGPLAAVPAIGPLTVGPLTAPPALMPAAAVAPSLVEGLQGCVDLLFGFAPIIVTGAVVLFPKAFS